MAKAAWNRLYERFLIAQKRASFDSFLGFLQGGAFPKWPVELIIDASNACNLRCSMCGFHSAAARRQPAHDVVAKPQSLDERSLLRALRPLMRHGLFLNFYSCGEPLLRPGFTDLLNRASGYLLATSFITNGTKLDGPTCEKVVDAGTYQARISASFLDKRLYENVYRGAVFEEVLANVERLAALRKRRGSPYPRIQINSIAFSEHLAELGRFVEVMAGLGVDDINLDPVCGYDWVPESKPLMVVYDEAKHGPLLQAAKRIAKEHSVGLHTASFEFTRPLPDGTIQDSIDRYTEKHPAAVHDVGFHASGATGPSQERSPFLEATPRAQLRTAELPLSCLEPFTVFKVLPDGRVLPCHETNLSQLHMGSIRKTSGLRIWRNAAFDLVRKGNLRGNYLLPLCSMCIGYFNPKPLHRGRELVHEYLPWVRWRTGLPLFLGMESQLDSLLSNSELSRRHAS